MRRRIICALVLGVTAIGGLLLWQQTSKPTRSKYVFINETGRQDFDLALRMSLKLAEKNQESKTLWSCWQRFRQPRPLKRRRPRSSRSSELAHDATAGGSCTFTARRKTCLRLKCLMRWKAT